MLSRSTVIQNEMSHVLFYGILISVEVEVLDSDFQI
jgi:hypothetical protein